MNERNLNDLIYQLKNFAFSNFSYTQDLDFNVLFGRMSHQLNQFENDINEKIITASKSTSNKKETPKNDDIYKKDGIKKLNDFNSVNQPIFLPKKDNLEKRNNKFFPRLLASQFEKPGSEPFIKAKNSKFLNKHPKLRKSNIFPQTVALSKEIRKNPFADLPPLSEKELRKGLISLQTVGIIPRDLDVGPAFARSAPLKIESKIFHHKSEENKSKKLPKDETFNILLDQNTFLTEKPTLSLKKSQLLDDSIKSQRFSLEKMERSKSPESLKLDLKKGKIFADTPSYQIMKQHYSEIWEIITIVITKLENFFAEHKIEWAYLDGKKIVKLARKIKNNNKNPLLSKIPLAELAHCILNQEIVKASMLISGRKFKGGKGAEIASKVIQSYWRNGKTRRDQKKLKIQSNAIKKIQNVFIMKRNLKETRKIIGEIKKEREEEFQQLLKKYVKEWEDVKYLERVEIHINSFAYQEDQRYTIENFLQKANGQISRIFALKDPLLEIIYIMPFQIDEEILNYYIKVLQLGEVFKKDKLHFIYPDMSERFPYTFSTIKKLLYSPKSIREIRKIVGSKPAYIVSGIPSEDDIDLACLLKIPYSNGNPLNCQFFSTKIGSRKIFESCEMPVATGEYNFKDLEDLYDKLAILILKNPSVNKWVFKINNEFGGRGNAIFATDFQKLLSQSKINRIDEKDQIQFISILKNILPIKLQTCSPTLYRSNSEFLSYFISKGGVIEATPPQSQSHSSISLHLKCEPNGNFEILSVCEKIIGPENRPIGFVNTVKVKEINFKLIAKTLCDRFLKFDVFGFISIDLLVFPDSDGKGTLFWGVGIDCFMNDFVAMSYFFDFLIKGKADPMTGRHYENLEKIENESENYDERMTGSEKFVFFCPNFVHHGLCLIDYKTFFQECRSNEVMYDIEKRSGISFILVDTIKNKTVNLISIAEDYQNCVKMITNALNFIVQYLSSLSEYKIERNVKDIRHDTLLFSDIVSKIRSINKEYQNRQSLKQKSSQ